MPSTVSIPIGLPIEITSAPPAFRIERRVKVEVFSILVMNASLSPSSSAARLTARMMFTWVPQRHLSPVSACLISSSVGFFLLLRSAAAVMTQPLMQ